MNTKKILSKARIASIKGYFDGFEFQVPQNPYNDPELQRYYNIGYNGGVFSFCFGEKSLEFDKDFRIIEESE